MLLLGLWLARTYIAVQFARSYFQSHGIVSSVEIGELTLSGVSARFALGPAEAPEISANRIELHFDPLRWVPFLTEVRLVEPVARVRVDDSGNVSFGSLQNWIDSLRRQQGKSRYVSDDLAVSLKGLRLVLATPARAEGRTVQRLGRLMRPHPGKAAPVLFDLVDEGGLPYTQFRARCVR